MAKKDSAKIVVVDNNQKKAEEEVVRITEKKETEEVKVVPTGNKPIPQRNVKVRLKKDHKCNIGGEWYVFKKDIRQDVPENVKNILAKADLLLPL